MVQSKSIYSNKKGMSDLYIRFAAKSEQASGFYHFKAQFSFVRRRARDDLPPGAQAAWWIGAKDLALSFPLFFSFVWESRCARSLITMTLAWVMARTDFCLKS